MFIFVIVPFVGQFTPLEVTSNNFKNSFDKIRSFGLPMAILLTLFGTLKPQDSKKDKNTKIVLTFSVFLISVFILKIIVFAKMCGWTDNQTLFYNINDKSTKIILRDFDCGALDSGDPVYKVCKIKNIFPNLIWVRNIDTTEIDRKVWLRVDNEERQ